MPHESVAACLDDQELTRVDRFAEAWGTSRDAALAALVISGLAVCELAARDLEVQPRPTESTGGDGRPAVPSPAPSTPSPWLGWAILVLVALLVGLGGWALVRALDRRARPAAPVSAAAPPAGTVAPKATAPAAPTAPIKNPVEDTRVFGN